MTVSDDIVSVLVFPPTGSSSAHLSSLLADGVGTEDSWNYHAQQVCRERHGKGGRERESTVLLFCVTETHMFPS